MTSTAAMKMNRLAPWFGADLAIAEEAAGLIGKRAWVGIPFCGGCSIVPFLETRSGLCSDLHRHIINLAKVIRDPELRPRLIQRLDRELFHPDVLRNAQLRCMERMAIGGANLFGEPEDDSLNDPVQWAADYFIACWMARGGHAGKESEFTQSLAVRFTSSGGGSAVRYRSAVESIEAWSSALRRWDFECCNVFDFLTGVKDIPTHALYIDAPWPDLGKEYKHKFTEKDQVWLRDRLESLEKIRIVVRFGLHDLIKELYSGVQWVWHFTNSRNQSNNEVTEALIVKGGG